MGTHLWGDKDFDWKALDDCQQIIYKFHKFGFLSPHCKEKYGTLRWSVDFGWISLHTLIYPGYMHIKFPKWLYNLDYYVFTPILEIFFSRLFTWWQKKVYNWIYQVMIKKHSHIKEEILQCSDWPEYIKGAKLWN